MLQVCIYKVYICIIQFPLYELQLLKYAYITQGTFSYLQEQVTKRIEFNYLSKDIRETNFELEQNQNFFLYIQFITDLSIVWVFIGNNIF